MSKALFWHRRDLRIADNAGLYKALRQHTEVRVVFIFDKSILAHLPKNDQRVVYLHQQINTLKQAYIEQGADLQVFYGLPEEIIANLAQELQVDAVYTNRDYEPKALQRDQRIFEQLQALNIAFIGAKDQVIFEKSEVVKDDNKPYTVFTPYSKKWKAKLNAFYLKAYPTENYLCSLQKVAPTSMPTLEALGFSPAQTQEFPSKDTPKEIIKRYHEQRDIPSILGTSRLSLHLRFGTISIRKLAQEAVQINEKYLNELIWRDFYQMILHHFPYTVDGAFKPVYDQIIWENKEADFQKWCDGKTGYPLVDAGMRELNSTGFMHNRVRMVVASFLTKHLLIDWRWGERYFAEKLLDFELASNIGGWQWAAGCGCDAAPYFRVFNPEAQQKKFDPHFTYIKKWVPEFGTPQYVQPIVEHKFARERVLARYKQALK